MFKISDKVVCVDDAFEVSQSLTYSSLPRKGVVYVIKGFCAAYPFERGDEPAAWLVGIRAVIYKGDEIPFRASRFRLLSEVQEENRLKATAEATT